MQGRGGEKLQPATSPFKFKNTGALVGISAGRNIILFLNYYLLIFGKSTIQFDPFLHYTKNTTIYEFPPSDENEQNYKQNKNDNIII